MMRTSRLVVKRDIYWYFVGAHQQKNWSLH